MIIKKRSITIYSMLESDRTVISKRTVQTNQFICNGISTFVGNYHIFDITLFDEIILLTYNTIILDYIVHTTSRDIQIIQFANLAKRRL